LEIKPLSFAWFSAKKPPGKISELKIAATGLLNAVFFAKLRHA